MKIAFVLPGWTRKPIGGFKIVYEHANRLAGRGHEIVIVHPLMISGVEMRLLNKLKYVVKWIIYVLLRVKRLKWFNVYDKVKLLIVPNLDEKYIPSADVVIATAWQTAEEVNKYGVDKGRKFYLIQHYEVWSGSKDKVDATWRMPLKKIVISRWLEEIALSVGQKAIYIPNGIDFGRFSITQPIDKRDPKTIGMLYHIYDWKGSREGIEALQIVKNRFPTLKVVFFSTYRPGSDLPNWIEFHRSPSPERLVEIYNSCSIFISPSWTEGWPLPPAEAMSCGCALVCTDNRGVREYAINEKTALISKIKDSRSLAENIIRLMENNEFRIELAKRGNQFIKQFTWEKALEKFEAVISER